LGGEHPKMAFGRDQLSGDALRLPLRVLIGRVDEIHSRVECGINDALGFLFVGAIAEHHGAEAKRRDFETTAAEFAVFHYFLRIPPFNGGDDAARIMRAQTRLSRPMSQCYKSSSP